VITDVTDIDLMDGVRRGEIHLLAHLFDRHHEKLFNYYVRLTGQPQLSEDMVQEAFFRMLKYRHTFRAEGDFTAWMYHLARNVHRDSYRKWHRETRLISDHEQIAAVDHQPHTAIEERQQEEMLARALEKLPVEKKEILILARLQELRYATIASLLGCSEAAVKVRVHRALKDLRTVYFQMTKERAYD
jgi:RNA polymerase sigma-70 factor, ECF subfamily